MARTFLDSPHQRLAVHPSESPIALLANHLSNQQTWSTEKTVRQPQRRATWSGLINSWWPELLSSFVSIASVGALVIVLQNLNGQPLPNWPLGLTLNTLIAFLATVARSTFVLPVTESISQVKWLWFRQSKPLRDFQGFDEASRGPWGSLKLIFRTKGSFASLITGIISISALFTSTLTQSIVTYPSRLAPVKSPTSVSGVSRTSQFLGKDFDINDRLAGTENRAQAIFSGLNHSNAKLLQLEAPTCSTSHCQYPVISSLEVCTKYWNVTSALNVTATEMKNRTGLVPVGLPNGVNGTFSSYKSRARLFPSQSMLGAQQYLPLWSTKDHSAMTAPSLLNLTIIWYNDRLMEPYFFGAVEILLYLCVNRYNVTMTDNVPSRLLIDSTYNQSDGPVVVEDERYQNVSGLKVPGDPSEVLPYNVAALRSTQHYLSEIMDGTTSHGGVPGIGYYPNGSLGLSSRAPDRYFIASSSDLGSRPNMTAAERSFEAIVNVTENIALSMTNSLYTAHIVGQALAPEIYVEVRWPWLTFMICQISLSILFLAATIVQTEMEGIPAVKADPLSVLFAVKTWDRVQLDDDFAHVKQRKHSHDIKKVKMALGLMKS